MWPDEFVVQLLTLLDRIEAEDDPGLATQRFELLEEYGLPVEFRGLGSDRKH